MCAADVWPINSGDLLRRPDTSTTPHVVEGLSMRHYPLALPPLLLHNRGTVVAGRDEGEVCQASGT